MIIEVSESCRVSVSDAIMVLRNFYNCSRTTSVPPSSVSAMA